MTTSLSGKASARADDVMSGLDVRMPVQAGQSTADLAEQMLARVRAGEGSGAASAAAAAPDVRPSSKPGALAELSVRAPPGPKPPPPAPAGPVAKVAGAAPSSASPAVGQQGAAGAKPASSASNGPVAATPPGSAAPAGPAVVTAASLIDETAAWLPAEPERRTAFLQVYRYWHKQVLPEFQAKATPAFLFLVTALPMMIKARDDLQALNLWDPSGEQSRQARDQHSAWRKYCEFLPRAQQALAELDAYRHLSLFTAIDDLMDRIVKAEKRYREGNPKR